MAFFSRPNLDNLQFKQLSGDTLNLGGKNIIESGGTLSFIDDIDRTITLNVSGGTDGDVLTLIGNEIVFREGSSGGTSYYVGKTPVSIDLGGWKKNEHLSGHTLNEIIEKLLVPTTYPSLDSPTYKINLLLNGANANGYLVEVGSNVINMGFRVKTIFNAGKIEPYYDVNGINQGIEDRVGDKTVYRDYIFKSDSNFRETNAIQNTREFDLFEIVNNPIINYGINNKIKSSVGFEIGLQPYDSDGNPFESPYNASTIEASTHLEGIFPYFYGKSENIIDVDDHDLLFNSTTNQENTINDTKVKVIKKSDNNIIIDFKFQEGENEKYIWFAIPTSSGIKTNWEVTTLNAGGIDTPEEGGTLFAIPQTRPKISENWSGVEYDIYISNYTTKVDGPMTIS